MSGQTKRSHDDVAGFVGEEEDRRVRRYGVEDSSSRDEEKER